MHYWKSLAFLLCGAVIVNALIGTPMQGLFGFVVTILLCAILARFAPRVKSDD